MRTKKPIDKKQVAPELSAAEVEKILKKIGKAIKAKRKQQSSLDNFAYEVNISRSALARYEAGGDMLLSSFIKVLYGLKINPDDFLKEIK
ncbi:hypothetical protein [Paraflavitalea speifideaquila]|uniref:hypothetical protein n=1 Tax=Paraflavitalea speifideaquila TaxID=3076558 RepID=UPI0028EA8D88|nr:hypothetical protein [Paraflavitalea speifideiaquila]